MILVYVEDGGELAAQAISFAHTLDDVAHAFAVGTAADLRGVEILHVAEHAAFASYAPAAVAHALVELVAPLEPSAVVAAGTERGNEVMAHVAATLDLPFAARLVVGGVAQGGEQVGTKG